MSPDTDPPDRDRPRIAGSSVSASDGADRPAAPSLTDLAYERERWSRGLRRIAGVDEVGRGPLAGPVLAAAVVLPPQTWIEGVADSKTLSPARRTALHAEIRRRAEAVGLGAASVREIDRLNVLRATTLAIRRALERLPETPDHVVVDGLPLRDLECPHDAVVDGDRLVHSIACASIVAKVIRDALMARLARRHPVYGWERNAGYGTAEHLEALRVHGPSKHHRLTFVDLQLELGI